ncbi:MAG: putative inorganic carbon ((-)) transporter [Thermoleophilaceae bacterium]|nr:putative inorganic carbon ((-)) transporter [Thermoleophilaceae bacterium]
MDRRRAGAISVASLAVVVAGAVLFATRLGALPSGTDSAALFVVAAIIVVCLALTVDPAWILSAGIVATMFAGHWQDIGVQSSFGPHRLLLAVGALAVLLRLPPARERPRLELGPVHYVLAAAVAYALVSAILAGTIGRRASQFVLLDDYGVLPFLMFLVAPVAFHTERQRKILLGTLMVVGGYLAVTAILEQLGLYNLVFPSYIGDQTIGTHFGRARGPFVEAGADGLALYACAVAAAIAMFSWRGRWPRAAAGAVVLLAPVGLLLTVTRSIWIAGAAATAVAMLSTPGLRRYLVPLFVAGAAAVLVAFAIIPGLEHKATKRETDKTSVWERQNTTAAGLRMVAARPLLGFGWDRADDRLEPYFRQEPNIPLRGARAGLHNVYLQYGVGLGLLGLGLWLLGGALAIRGAFTGRTPPELRPWAIGLKAILVAWVLVGLSTPASYIFSTVVLWTWAGIANGPPGARRLWLPSQLDGGATTWSRLHGNPARTSSG